MHRFLQFNCVIRPSFGRLYENGHSGSVYLLCKQPDRFVQVRNQSNLERLYLQTKSRRKRKKLKKTEVEMLVENKNSLSPMRANVQKLTFSDLKLLASTNLSLSELHKLKYLSKESSTNEQYTYNNLSDITNLTGEEQIKLNNIKSDEKAIDFNVSTSFQTRCDINKISSKSSKSLRSAEERLSNGIEVESINDKLIRDVEENIENELDSEEADNTHPIKPYKEELTHKMYRQEITLKTLAAYIEVCSNLKNPQRGLNALYFHRGRARKRNENYLNAVKSMKVYNSLLKGFAHKGDYNKMLEVLQLLEEERCHLNLQSYIAILECLGRINNNNRYNKDIAKYAKEANEKGFTFDKMMDEGVFLNNEREIVLKAIRVVDPNYVPKYKHPTVQYKNHLLNPLNDKKQLEPCPINFNNGNSSGIFTPSSLQDCVKKQIEIEKQAYVTVNSIEDKDPLSDEVFTYRGSLKEHYDMWQKSATTAFQRDLAALSAQRNALNMEPYLRCIPANEYVTIIVEEAKKLAQGSETYSPTVNLLYKDLGSRVYMRYMALNKEKNGVLEKIKDVHNEYCVHYANTHQELDVLPKDLKKINPRQTWQWFEYNLKNEGATLSMDHRPWVPTTLQYVGKFLYHIIMHDLKIDVNSLKNNKHKNYLPAFYTVFRTQGRIVKEEVKPHPALCKLYRASVPATLTFPTQEVPMFCPPVPWISVETGSYILLPSEFIRLPFYASSQKQKLAEAGTQQLYPALDALNQLASIPWKVNQKILDVILEVFKNGGSADLDVPESPTSLAPPPNSTPEMDKNERYQLFKQRMQYRRKKAEMYSLWCDCLYRLSLANHYRNDVFWLPHNMDFRGRVYPIPPHLNHMGSDLARSMLIFAEARPLGPNGLDWLKLHLVNLTGLKKRDSIKERLAFANHNIDLILDSANRPLTGKRWWAKSDEPWQTLACCMEIAEAMKCDDPATYKSHFPIHQDGSCNGLQHYAALGRDASGAYSVNLTSTERPQDVYSAVVTLVEEQRAKDAANGVEIAKVLSGFVKRKVIKQTVMTTVYGVTRFGARLQIAKQLKDIDDFPKEYIWQASSYLTGRTFDSLRSMFTSTREIQDWFTECARLISAVGGQHVEWVTPLGLPVVQPYFKMKKMSPSVYEPFHIDLYEKPNVMKQKNAFPPNFIHSLDSSHMMLTSLFCERTGITFVSVHDCFWTHASTVNIMNKVCREQFVALHSEKILEELSKFLSSRYSYSQHDFAGDGSVMDLTKKKLNRILKKLPKKGTFDINEVLKSVYFFS